VPISLIQKITMAKKEAAKVRTGKTPFLPTPFLSARAFSFSSAALRAAISWDFCSK